MTTAADLLQALLARMPGKLILDRRTGLPYGWGIWMRGRLGTPARFDDNQLTDALLARPAPRPRDGMAGRLSPFQAFRSLWWQHWDPRPRDERPLHWGAVLGSGLIHLGFIALLLWVVSVRWAPDDTKQGDEARVRLTYVGEGAADQGGGEGEPAADAAPATAASGAQQAAASAAAASSAAASPASTASTVAEPVEPAADVPDVAPEPVVAAAAEPSTPDIPQIRVQVPQVTLESPLQVTETPVPTTDFVVPPPPTITVAPRPIEPAAPQVRQREIQTVTERPQVRELQQPTAAVAVRAAAAPTVREREIVVPEQARVTAPTVRARELVPTVRMPELAVRAAELPNVPDPAPQPTPAQTPPAQPTVVQTPSDAAVPIAPAAPAPSSAPSAANQTNQQTAAQSAKPASAAAASSKPAASSGAGPKPVDRSGGWDVAANADDWSKSTRDRPGQATGADGKRDGMFNNDGSVRVAAGGEAGNGAGDRGPPGSDTDTWTRDQIAQGGTWLKRPPYGYTPTSLDKYWMPNQTLLQEWVRRGLKKIEIPIPGTTTKISCVVSLLQFGGGCGLSDPNLNDQPATARPPPDVPFKRELQEGNGAVR
ncbi:transmembrane repetitive protein [Xanthomonas campestris pv. incanae]|uniref:transmembrane repetitive protein n=1 Tax=Xanthomonas campestris TaxID=339 RepID=UPI0029C54E9C|nr:transmembrane repetitive protein [Xanthomonas campestris]MDX6083492.1 transmembrane repetitive protein [Xanthomonas campestris pv. incanae]MDX6087716.1 transmembrane repetitive protein [Xanthomonas campestris pv. incanae]MDX6141217.1 transmembrane repetitive protein [Xanthomonas campestris pv. incanae]